jgi:hypothetical protein
LAKVANPASTAKIATASRIEASFLRVEIEIRTNANPMLTLPPMVERPNMTRTILCPGPLLDLLHREIARMNPVAEGTDRVLGKHLVSRLDGGTI